MAKKKDKEETEEKTEAPAGEEAEGEEGEGGAKKGKKGLIFIIIGVVVIAAIVGGLFAAGVIGGKKKPADDAAVAGDEKSADDKAGDKDKPDAAKASADKPVYYELPQFLVNLNASGSHTSFLKMSVTLELRDQGAVAIVEANKPRIVDVFNTFLRELRPADVQGSAGIYRLRDELMSRLNATIEEGLVKDILFTEIIVQ